MQEVALSNSLQELAQQVSASFTRRFERPPRWIVAAPGRVNVIGEHIDYSDGFVLPMAIDRYCVIAADTRLTTASGGNDRTATILSATNGGEVNVSMQSPQRHSVAGHWSNYVIGVLAGFRSRGANVPAFEAVVDTNVPIGGGLSSSASLEVATATLLEAMTGVALDPTEKALLCQKAEHDFAGVPCGVMDQFASTMGRADHLMLLDCRSREVEHIPLNDPALTVLIINSNIKHELSGGEYAERRSQCESAARKLGVASLREAAFPQLKVRARQLQDVEFRRARHAISEIARTVKAASALKAGDWLELGRLMYASHDSLRDDYEVSCNELDVLVDAARRIGVDGGVIGSRMTGGGFGGCTVSLVDTSKVDSVTLQILDEYRDRTGLVGSALTSRPARGAHVIHGTH
jgi:galactokinase